VNFEASSDPPQEPVRYCHSEAKAEESRFGGDCIHEILRPGVSGTQDDEHLSRQVIRKTLYSP